ncbi:MAG: hypothetical protein Q9166_003087 [cf. Caloplaca sp. 2 TL-2023]
MVKRPDQHLLHRRNAPPEMVHAIICMKQSKESRKRLAIIHQRGLTGYGPMEWKFDELEGRDEPLDPPAKPDDEAVFNIRYQWASQGHKLVKRSTAASMSVMDMAIDELMECLVLNPAREIGASY